MRVSPTKKRPSIGQTQAWCQTPPPRYAPPVRVALIVVIAVLLGAAPLRGQAPGAVSFRILEHGLPIGDARVTIARADTGWTLTGSAALGGTVGLDVRRFELVYDAAWRGR